ncbi:MAG: O-antigen ligase family protein [Cellulosilyticaceae bacterium]
MENEKESKSSSGYNINFDWIRYIPIIILLGIVPLIVRLALVDLEPNVAVAFKTPQILDFFSHYKAILILLMAGVSIFMLFLIFEKRKIKNDKMLMVYGLGTSIFIVFSLLSTVFSKYSNMAWWGAPDRGEGMMITLAYIVIMVYTIYIVQKIEDYRYIIVPLSVLIIITAFLGVYQYIGKDLLLETEIGKNIVVPEQYKQIRDGLENTIGAKKIYGTMFHYNYVGSFGAMMVPLFGTLALFVSGKKNRVFFAGMTIVSMFILFGSTSRAGIMGLLGAAVVAVIVFSKILIKRYKIVVPIIVGIVILLFGFNFATKGSIFERIPTLVNDAFALFTPGDDSFDYKDHIPVRDITFKNGETTLEMQEDKLNIGYLDEKLVFTDKNNNLVNYIIQDGQHILQDPRFSAFTFEVTNLAAHPQNDILACKINGRYAFFFKLGDPKGMYLVDSYAGEKIEMEFPNTIGFKGKEKLGSMRGYIFSRSIPMLKETLILGNGPDTYLMEFPQNDLLGKFYAYDTPNMTVDKAHNLYLQLGINNGVIALIGFLILVIGYAIDSLRLYGWRGIYSKNEVVGIALFLAVTGYLGAGMFNDSVVSVAPIFWILLGTGIAVNYIINKERISMQKSLQHAIINIKTKKHL